MTKPIDMTQPLREIKSNKNRLKALPSLTICAMTNQWLEKEEQAVYDRLLLHTQNTPLAFIECDKDGHLKSWCKRAEEIYGWTGNELLEIQHNGSRRNRNQHLSRAGKILEQLSAANGDTNEVEYKNLTKDGRMVCCVWYNSVLKDNDGKIKTVISLVLDITEQKRLELQNDNLFSVVSHELNTPLTIIKAYGQIAQTLLENNGAEQILGVITKMNSQINTLTNLTKDLLDFTRTQTGDVMYYEALYDINQLIKEVIHEMQVINVGRKIKYSFGKTTLIYGDKNKLTQVFMNLISNAIKYSPEGTSIVIRATVQKNGGIKLSVKDFGIGISIENKKKVFDKFYRLNHESQSTFPGIGIGLHVSSQIIARQGGKIWLESTVGKGSTFYVWLPFDHRNNC